MIGLPFIIMGRVPQYFILILVLGIMAFAVVSLFASMILLLKNKNLMHKLLAPVMIPSIAAIIFFALITYQLLGPQLVDPERLPYFEQVRQIDFMNIFGYLPFFATGIFFLFLVPFIIYFLKFQFENAFSREKTLKNGISASAKILKVEAFGVLINHEPVYKITLEINSPLQGSYQITKDFLIPHFTLSQIKVGGMINVKVDPDNPQNVSLDTWTGNV